MSSDGPRVESPGFLVDGSRVNRGAGGRVASLGFLAVGSRVDPLGFLLVGSRVDPLGFLVVGSRVDPLGFLLVGSRVDPLGFFVDGGRRIGLRVGRGVGKGVGDGAGGNVGGMPPICRPSTVSLPSIGICINVTVGSSILGEGAGLSVFCVLSEIVGCSSWRILCVKRFANIPTA
jgi:hypothetical protein